MLQTVERKEGGRGRAMKQSEQTEANWSKLKQRWQGEESGAVGKVESPLLCVISISFICSLVFVII